MIREPFYRKIIEGLHARLDPELFEQCAADLLRAIYPTLVPIPGGKDAGMDGVVASPKEVGLIREACGEDFAIVTPGVRPTFASQDDQKRVTTPGDAIRAGADYLVIGRPISAADNPVEAAKLILEEMQEALQGS